MLQRHQTRSELAGSSTLPVALPSSAIALAIATVLLVLPNLLFLATHVASPLVASACALAAAAAAALLVQELWLKRDSFDGQTFGICVTIGIALCLLGGETHLFFANDDWLIRDAVLGDLSKHPWPLGYHFEDQANLLRAPLGMYLTPALLGGLFGIKAAHAALLAQNGLLLGCALHAVATGARSRRQALVIVLVFVMFSGWDVVGQALVGKSLGFGTHLSQWAGRLQYSAAMVQIFWVPNHALPGWIFIGAYLAWQRGDLSSGGLCALFAPCIFWSPLSAMGALPFLAHAVLSDMRAFFVDRRGLVAALLAVIGITPILLYLGMDFGRVPHGSIHTDAAALGCYVVFEMIEVLPFALLFHFGAVTPGFFRRPDTLILFAILLCAPLYQIGSADFVMRASIPALALLALNVARFIDPGEDRFVSKQALAGLAVLAIGAATPVYEIGRAVTSPPYRISACNLMTANRFPPFNAPLYHYLARTEFVSGPRSILKLPGEFLAADPRRTTCWPDDKGFRG